MAGRYPRDGVTGCDVPPAEARIPHGTDGFEADPSHRVILLALNDPPLLNDTGEDICHLSGFDLSSPFVDAALPGGERLHVAIPDVTRTDWAVTVSYTHLTLPTNREV